MRLRWTLSLRPRRQGAALTALLLDPEDLDSGTRWRVRDGRVLTSGASDPKEEWAKRERAAGSITVWRSFELSDADKVRWIEIIQLSSEVDAPAALRSTSRYDIPNPAFRGVIRGERVLMLTIAGASMLAKQNDVEVEGHMYVSCTCSYSVQRFVVTIISASRTESPDELTRLAEIQAARILKSSS